MRCVFRSLSKLRGKHWCWSHFSIKLQQSATLLKKDSNAHRRFSMKFAKSLTTPVLKNICAGDILGRFGQRNTDFGHI